jgi:16S rRNA (guanine966-N2)-methyltransferase
MRIIAGKYKGRKLFDHNEKYIRPYTDRIKESVFASLEEKLINARVLDLYAGSGSIGLEALSRGAGFVTFNDLSSRALTLIKKNAEKIGVKRDEYRLVQSEDISFLKNQSLNYDVVFLDPPFAYSEWGMFWQTMLNAEWKVEPLIVFRYEKKIDVQLPDQFTIIRSKKYGKSIVNFMEIKL